MTSRRMRKVWIGISDQEEEVVLASDDDKYKMRMSCTVLEDHDLHLLAERRYPSSIRIFEGSLLVAIGSHVRSLFYDIDP